MLTFLCRTKVNCMTRLASWNEPGISSDTWSRGYSCWAKLGRRLAKAAIKKSKNKIRKPSGQKSFLPEKKSMYTNWFTPFLFQQIEEVWIVTGDSKWSTRAIEQELKKSSPDVFRNFRHTTLNEWINYSGNQPRWSDKTLVQIKKGNDLGQENAGHKGVLVHCLCHIFVALLTYHVPG